MRTPPQRGLQETAENLYATTSDKQLDGKMRQKSLTWTQKLSVIGLIRHTKLKTKPVPTYFSTGSRSVKAVRKESEDNGGKDL